MTLRAFRRLLVLIALTAVLAACGAGKAPDTTSVTRPLALPPDTNAVPAAGPAADGALPEAAPASFATTQVPAATDDIWKALDRQSYALQKAVDGGAWKDVPASADAIRDLTAALPAHAARLTADEQGALQQKVALIATYVEKLDAAAGSGDAAGARGAEKKMSDALGSITRFP